MEKWEKVVYKFLDEYKDKDFFLGAILTGSYATGNQNKFSDIDIYIVAKNSINWRERGNKLIDGYIIDYFIDPVRKINEYLDKESKTYELINTRAFATGKILSDKDKTVENLVEKAKEILNGKLKDLDSYTYSMNCYKVFEYFAEVESKYRNKMDIDLSYYLFIERLVHAYLQNKKIGSVSLNKLEYILENKEFKEKYSINKLPDEKFIELLKDCLKEKDYNKRFVCAKRIYDHFTNEFSDFDINNFSLVDRFEW